MVFAAILVVLLAAPAAERPALTGVVEAPGDRPLAGAMVFIYAARPRSGASTACPSCYLDCRKHAETNADGAFAIAGLDPALLFQVGVMAEGHQASFRADVDPTTGPIRVTLAPQPPLPDNPRRVVLARVVDGDGVPVLGAFVEPVGTQVDRPNGGWLNSFGSIGVSPTMTNRSGRFSLAVPHEVDSLFVSVVARGLAPKTFRGVRTGTDVNQLRLGPGRSIRGRVVRDGSPIGGATVGVVQLDRNAETFVGERTAETDDNGRFLLLNLPPDEPLVVYGKVDGLGARGTITEREMGPAAEGSALDLGDVVAEPGLALSGRVVLADGKPVPPHTRIAVGRERAWDHTEKELAPDGRFRFPGLPRETLTVSLRLPGYELSLQNESLLPDSGGPRQSLAGRLEQDTELRIVLVPVGHDGPAAAPRSAVEWSTLHARQKDVRSRPLHGAPIAR